ncbi:MAG: hypothetical protein EOM12_15795 [Verrucomicrobiae bacterium]|nr:hypothetical protein [Verrucomicrobiae bacterium]
MYQVNFVEHFEDWYVSEDDIGEFETLNEAMQAFREECNNLLTNNFFSDGIDEFISENFSDKDDMSNFSKGFAVSIYRDDAALILLHFDYDSRKKSVVSSHVVELEEGELSGFDLSEYKQSR